MGPPTKQPGMPPNRIAEMARCSSSMPSTTFRRTGLMPFRTTESFPSPSAPFTRLFPFRNQPGALRRARQPGNPRLPAVRTRFGGQIPIDKKAESKKNSLEMNAFSPSSPVTPSIPGPPAAGRPLGRKSNFLAVFSASHMSSFSLSEIASSRQWLRGSPQLRRRQGAPPADPRRVLLAPRRAAIGAGRGSGGGEVCERGGDGLPLDPGAYERRSEVAATSFWVICAFPPPFSHG